tara:strand:- start:1555 stop:2304 length:750 start_codon:yes stop_codon:yes gene_type:complete
MFFTIHKITTYNVASKNQTMTLNISDIPSHQNHEVELFPLSIFGGEFSVLNPVDDIGDDLEKLWKLELADGANLIDLPEWSEIEVPISKAIAKATRNVVIPHQVHEVAIAEARWHWISPKRESRPPLSCNYEMTALLFNSIAPLREDEVYAVRIEDPAGDLKIMSQQGDDDMNLDNRPNHETINLKAGSILVFPSYLRHIIYHTAADTPMNVIQMQIVFPHRSKNPAVIEHFFELEKESLQQSNTVDLD